MTYSYECQGKCKTVQDRVHGMNEEPVFMCCGKEMKKFFGTPPIGIHGANTGRRRGT